MALVLCFPIESLLTCTFCIDWCLRAYAFGLIFRFYSTLCIFGDFFCCLSAKFRFFHQVQSKNMGCSYIRYLNAIQTSAPHLLRYLATAFIVNKRRRPQFKEFIKVVQQEQHSYKDPITEFLACVYVNYDFDGAQKKMKECEEVSFLYLNFPEKNKKSISLILSGWACPMRM